MANQPGLPWPPAQRSYVPPPVASTNTMAILSLVFAFVLSPLGVAFGLVAKSQIHRTGERGDGLATAGILTGTVITVFWALWLLVWVALVILAVVGAVAGH